MIDTFSDSPTRYCYLQSDVKKDNPTERRRRIYSLKRARNSTELFVWLIFDNHGSARLVKLCIGVSDGVISCFPSQ